MKVNGVQCPNCKDIIYSRANHDFHYCSCGECFVDGGQSEYGCRVGYTKAIPEAVELELYTVQDKKELVRSWGEERVYACENRLGIIKGGQVDLRHKILSIGDVRFDGERGPKDDVHGPGGVSGIPDQPKPEHKAVKKRSRRVGDARS